MRASAKLGCISEPCHPMPDPKNATRVTVAARLSDRQLREALEPHSAAHVLHFPNPELAFGGFENGALRRAVRRRLRHLRGSWCVPCASPLDLGLRFITLPTVILIPQPVGAGALQAPCGNVYREGFMVYVFIKPCNVSKAGDRQEVLHVSREGTNIGSWHPRRAALLI